MPVQSLRSTPTNTVTIKDLIAIIRLPFRKDRELYRSIHQILGFYPHDIRPYREALMHKSAAARGERGQRINNERLEFLGDAVLDAVVGDIVFRHFPNKSEGFMTNTRSKIVQRETLNRIAIEMELDRLIQSNGHARSAHNSYMCGNAFEALVGAVYLDRGYSYCMQFMEKQILKRLVDIDKVAYKEVNFKSKLLEWSQKNRIKMEFVLVEEGKEEGKNPTFVTRVMIEGINCGIGKGYSKKESQQEAAKEALMQMRRQKSLERSVFDAKGKRTAMEEQPIALLPEVPMTEEKTEVKENKPRQQERRAKKQQKKVDQQSQAEPVAKPEAEPAKQEQKQSTAEQKSQDKAGEKPAEKQKRNRRKPAKKVDAQPDQQPAVDTQDNAAEEAPQTTSNEEKAPRRRRPARRRPAKGSAEATPQDGVEIDFSSVSMREKTRDEIIAEAEAQAFGPAE